MPVRPVLRPITGRRSLHGIALGLVFLTIPAPPTRADVEPWTDPGLPVHQGLILWVDAGRQPAARGAGRLPSGPSGAQVESVLDGSGLRHHLAQRRGECQPRWISTAGRAVVRFDGRDDALERTGLDLKLDGVSIFLVAAPASNLGGFRGLLAGNQAGVNDYTSGFTVDLGPSPSSRLEFLNVEGKGFGGAVNLLKGAQPFGRFHLFQVVIPAGAGAISGFLDDDAQATRPRQPATMRIDELTLGARCYSNEPRPVHVQGFFHGDLAEVLVYGRAVSDAERKRIAGYLAAKHRGLSETIKGDGEPDGGHALRTVADPPPFQMLVPGFATRELSVSLPNINNVRYRHDGALMALAYDGNVHLLKDTDGDGLEDRAVLFWDNRGRIQAPIGMALTAPGDPRGKGLYVASKGKCSLILDTDGDDRADEEILVADGWKPLPHGVDALGVALGADGSVYFGLGAANFTNPYLIDGQGQAHYDLKGERGTILRVSPDFRTREIIATGIRFPVGLSFNDQGDLFATDQEGATWLPNGNPFDELLHIRPGRHYGFPPRHSRFLPRVVDEPSTFDYTPQHQSTCGLLFNSRASGAGGVFGPSWWEGNAIVCGYSRGKLFRTELVKVRGEYAARSALIGVAGMLLVDACVSPAGDLVVAAHGGAPDWGSGPDGKGKLYKITGADNEQPRPLVAWSSGPREARVTFDRPLDPARLHDLARGASIEFGPSVSAGDRFETLRPGYAVVAGQLAQLRCTLKVQGVNLTPDRRSLILQTDPQTEPVAYALTLPGLGRVQASGPSGKALPQVPDVDLAFDLGGCLVEWTRADGQATWSGWLPHADLAVARAFTARSPEHERFWTLVEQPGTLTIRTQLHLAHLLRPAVQPGSEIEDKLSPERAMVRIRAARKLRVETKSSAASVIDFNWTENRRRVGLKLVAARENATLVPVVITLQTGPGTFLNVDFQTGDDSLIRALQVSRFLLPWARLDREGTPRVVRPVAALAGGDWRRGLEVFRSPEAGCVKCHRVRGEGGSIGPDLSNLVERDYDSVLRDLATPSAAIHPDYVTYSIALTDGRVLSGPVRTEGKSLRIGNPQGEETVVSRADVEEMKPQGISIMPEGLPAVLGPERMKNLLTFLLTPPLAPAPIHRDDPPAPRGRAEVEKVLKAGTGPADPARPGRRLHITLVSGEKDHGVDEHDYPLWLERWSSLLRMADAVTVSEAKDWPAAEDLARTDVMVWYSANAKWTAEKARELDAFLDRGGGLVVLHYALNGNQAVDELASRIGLSWRGGSKFRHGPLDLSVPEAPRHPITAGFETVHFVDETYWNLTGDPSRVTVLASGEEEGKPQPLLWTREQGKGRVFCCVLGHYTWTFDDPLFRILVLRGICWTARDQVDRLSALATQGARVEGGAK